MYEVTLNNDPPPPQQKGNNEQYNIIMHHKDNTEIPLNGSRMCGANKVVRIWYLCIVLMVHNYITLFILFYRAFHQLHYYIKIMLVVLNLIAAHS